MNACITEVLPVCNPASWIGIAYLMEDAGTMQGGVGYRTILLTHWTKCESGYCYDASRRLRVVTILMVGCNHREYGHTPRIPSAATNFPFQVKRLLDPTSMCFAMVINNRQGRTLGTVDVDLRLPCVDFTLQDLGASCSWCDAM
ncbi:hypothetical protein EVAR_26787_1 [Eumeta japonica]|uniref:Uncharacterized protein n=1 Tax=Eumeta variegata TaxID=151549 RepID=A0A4C1WF97_EUMVA|nr:hypothetical protein EVAR_26787_1 [Eumeta japonica]